VGNPDDPTQNQPPEPADDGTTEDPTQAVPPSGDGEQPTIAQQVPPVPAPEQSGYPQPWSPQPWSPQPWPEQQPWQGQQQWPQQQPWAGQPDPGQPGYPGLPFPSQLFPMPPQQAGFPAAGVGGGMPPPGMPPGPGGYPGYPGNPPPSGGDKARWLIGAGVTVVVIVVAAVVGMWAGGVFDGGGGDDKSMPSAKARDLVIDRSAFPAVSGGRFRVTSSDDRSILASPSRNYDDEIEDSYDPSECETIAQPGRSQAESVDQASATLANYSSESRSSVAYRAAVEKAIDPIFEDYDKLLSTCATYTNTSRMTIAGRTSTYSYRITTKKLTVGGVNGDYLGIEVASTESDSSASTYHTRLLFGKARGMSFMVGGTGKSLDSSVDSDLVAMFNAQREKINQAP
jgi:hypothetical protein